MSGQFFTNPFNHIGNANLFATRVHLEDVVFNHFFGCWMGPRSYAEGIGAYIVVMWNQR